MILQGHVSFGSIVYLCSRGIFAVDIVTRPARKWDMFGLYIKSLVQDIAECSVIVDGMQKGRRRFRRSGF